MIEGRLHLGGLVRERWADVPRGRRVLAAAALLLAVAVVLLAVPTATGPLAPWTAFIGSLAVVVVLVGLIQASARVIAAGVAMLGLVVALSGLGDPVGAAEEIEIALVAAAVFLVAELANWSGDKRTQVFSDRPDVRRTAFVFGIAVGGGILGGVAVAVADGTTGSAGGLLAEVGAAVACCLVVGLAVLLLAGSERPRA